jgi:hypothetical protein
MVKAATIFENEKEAFARVLSSEMRKTFRIRGGRSGEVRHYA